MEGNLRSQKQALDDEKQIRTTIEFDLQRMRIEIQELEASKQKAGVDHQKAMNDLKYENEENIRLLNLRNDDIQELHRQMDALNLTIDAKNQQIEDLKNSVVEAEIKSRKAVDRLNKVQAGEAQENIDKSLLFLNQIGIRDARKMQDMENQGVLSNSDNRLNTFMPEKLTPEAAVQQLKAQQSRLGMDENSASSYSFQDSHSVRPAKMLQQSLDHNNWQTPGLGGAQQSRPKSLLEKKQPGERAHEENQMTSNMIKQSLADLRHRLNSMKQESETYSQHY